MVNALRYALKMENATCVKFLINNMDYTESVIESSEVDVSNKKETLNYINKQPDTSDPTDNDLLIQALKFLLTNPSTILSDIESLIKVILR